MLSERLMVKRGDMEQERTLIKKAKMGDTHAFEELIRRHMRAVYYTALYFVKNHFDADEVAQNTFINAYRKLYQFKGKSSFKTWLMSITANQAKSHLRKKMKGGDHEYLDTIPDPKSDSLSHVLSREEKRLLERAVENLPEKQRIVVMLRLKQELTFPEIATVLGMTTNSAKVNFHHGIRRVKHQCRAILTQNKGVAKDDLQEDTA
jgi:RNA polymerase sigma-70 factor (ECF subfamily)